MWLTFRSGRHRLLAHIMLATVGLTAVATADPLVPTKVPTITIGPPSAEDHPDQLASPTDVPRDHSLTILTVRPRSPGDNRDASGRQLPSQDLSRDLGQTAPDADHHLVRTMTIRPNPDAPPAAAPRPLTITSFANRHVIQTIRVPPQAGSQYRVPGLSHDEDPLSQATHFQRD
jgi:hypothetical protein